VSAAPRRQPRPARTDDVLLRVEGLTTEFATADGVVQALRGSTFTVRRGETLGIVGESGSGKSVTARSLLRIIRPPGRIVAGSAVFDGVDLMRLDERAMRRYRGRELAMIFQEPSAALNPVLTIGEQIAEVLRHHHRLGHRAAWRRAVALLEEVGIASAAERAGNYPHQLSGGMQQRCVIAIALACEPRLLIADEPTTSLDVTVQAQILRLLRALVERKGAGLIFITHDIAVVAQMADRIMVMYGGRIMEDGPVDEVIGAPHHPYTRELLQALPSLRTQRGVRLREIVGEVPNMLQPPPGCPFEPRCPVAMPVCTTDPALETVAGERRLACWLDREVPAD
jgi:oligopeptide/dipeptide ABC transporter ATP-binding protein